MALARRESPHRGSRLVGLAQALVHEMPGTMAALRAGQISEWRATIVARETACLTREDRQTADGELAGRSRGWVTGRSRQRPARSPTGWTRTRSPAGPRAPSGTGGSPCARRRTP